MEEKEKRSSPCDGDMRLRETGWCEWPALSRETMLCPGQPVLPLRARSGSVTLLKLGFMLMSVAVFGLYRCPLPCNHPRPCIWPWSGLSLKTMLISKGHAEQDPPMQQESWPCPSQENWLQLWGHRIAAPYRAGVPERPGLTNSTTNKAHIYDLLEFVKVLVLLNHSCRVSLTWGNSRISNRSHSEDPLLKV